MIKNIKEFSASFLFAAALSCSIIRGCMFGEYAKKNRESMRKIISCLWKTGRLDIELCFRPDGIDGFIINKDQTGE